MHLEGSSVLGGQYPSHRMVIVRDWEYLDGRWPGCTDEQFRCPGATEIASNDRVLTTMVRDEADVKSLFAEAQRQDWSMELRFISIRERDLRQSGTDLKLHAGKPLAGPLSCWGKSIYAPCDYSKR